MRAYRCASMGCGRGLSTDMEPPRHCSKCGGNKWAKLLWCNYRTTLRILWMTRGRLLVLPEDSRVATFLSKFMPNQKETGALSTGVGEQGGS